MTQLISTNAIHRFEATDREEDIVITDVTRSHGSAREQQRYDKWKQKLRIELIREQFEMQQNSNPDRKPVLLQLLNLSRDR